MAFRLPILLSSNHLQDNLTETTPFFSFPATSNPAVTQEIDITFGPNDTKPVGFNLFYMNNVSFRGNYE